MKISILAMFLVVPNLSHANDMIFKESVRSEIPPHTYPGSSFRISPKKFADASARPSGEVTIADLRKFSALAKASLFINSNYFRQTLLEVAVDTVKDPADQEALASLRAEYVKDCTKSPKEFLTTLPEGSEVSEKLAQTFEFVVELDPHTCPRINVGMILGGSMLNAGLIPVSTLVKQVGEGAGDDSNQGLAEGE